jgi:ABC-type sugar transport system permease subunit
MLPVMLVNVILSLSGAFVRNFDIVQVLTQGGPNHATDVVMTLMVREAFQNGNMGYASAMGYALFLMVGLVCIGLIGLIRRTRLDW